MSREGFDEYVRRVMKQKGLKAVDVERNSGNKIDRSHVSKFMRGVETNPSANAMMALAAGLGVNGHEVFTAVTGCVPEDGKPPLADVLEFLALAEKVAADPELVNAMQGMVSLSRRGRGAVMKMLRLRGEASQAAGRKRPRSKKKR